MEKDFPHDWASGTPREIAEMASELGYHARPLGNDRYVISDDKDGVITVEWNENKSYSKINYGQEIEGDPSPKIDEASQNLAKEISTRTLY